MCVIRLRLHGTTRLKLRNANPKAVVAGADTFPLPKDGLVGIAVNGVLIYKDHEGGNGTRLMDNDFDSCMGHTKASNHAYVVDTVRCVCLYCRLTCLVSSR